MAEGPRFGIYLNVSDKVVVRINSPYWIPEESDWIFLTAEVNATLVRIRGLIGEKSLIPTPDEVIWGSIPLRD